MKKYTVLLMALLLAGGRLLAQESAALTVKYMVSYDESQKTYTAWVVPNYDTPNANNLATEEKGATAQVTLKVPQGFTLSNLRDIKGSWDKQPPKIGGAAPYARLGAEAGYEYYVIGKAPVETNFGAFRRDEPVALFSFSGKGGDFKDVQVLDSRDPFVQLADEHFSLNVGNSFYSRSGQYHSVAATPLEQFSAPTNVQKVLTEIAKNADAELLTSEAGFDESLKLIAYPNPVQDQLTVKYFSLREGGDVALELVNLDGKVQDSYKLKATYGINTLKMNVSRLNEGLYLLRTRVDDAVISRKILKGR